MADQYPTNETSDNLGDTKQYNAVLPAGGSVTLSYNNVCIDEFIINNLSGCDNLDVKIGSETNHWSLCPRNTIAWTPKGTVNSITLEGTEGEPYQAIINYGTD